MDRAKCTLCLACVRGCYINARKLQGMKYTVDALVQEVLKDTRPFSCRSGGGVQLFSGGEPLLQAAFLNEGGAGGAAGAAGAVSGHETRLCAAGEPAAGAAQVDAFFYDFKHIDPARHKAPDWPRQAADLENLHWLLEISGQYFRALSPYPAAMTTRRPFAASRLYGRGGEAAGRGRVPLAI